MTKTEKQGKDLYDNVLNRETQNLKSRFEYWPLIGNKTELP